MPKKFGSITKTLYLCSAKSNEIIDTMKWNELIKIATDKGYRLYAHGKKHDIYVNDNGERLIVERHASQEIRKGLMNALKKQLGF